MKTILVPIDFSPTSLNAAWFAFNIAQKTNAMLIFLHAYRIPVDNIFLPGEVIHELIFDRFVHAEKNFKKYILDYLQTQIELYEITEPSPIMKFDLEYGFPVDLIFERAHYYQIDMVVMGNKGSSQNLNKLLGSVTNKVIKGIEFPVLVVPENAQYQDFKKIAYATDFDPKDESTLSQLKKFAQVFNSSIELVHIAPEQQIPHFFDDSAFAKMNAQNELSNQLNQPVQTIAHKSLDKGIEQYLSENNCDLLVMLTHSQPWFKRIMKGSVTRKMAQTSKTPLLAYH